MARSKERISGVEYGIAICSFIPGLGICFGLAAIILGALRVKAGGIRLVLLGGSGILLGSLFFGFMVLHHWKRAIPQKIYTQMSQEYLKQTVMAVEYYKLIHGSYPSKLEDLDTRHDQFLYDTSSGNFHLKFHQYALLPDREHYALFDVGPDGLSGTADDVYPVILDEEVGHIGYLKD